jgi:hypothetical protein
MGDFTFSSRQYGKKAMYFRFTFGGAWYKMDIVSKAL